MGPKKAKSKMPVDGVDTTTMSREQLEAFCIRLREELDREREERNFFQLERDKLRTFWEITRQQLEESRAQQRNQDRAIDELEEKHQAEIKVYKQKVKHLLYEHQCNLSELKVESMVSLKQAQDDFNAMEQQLLKDKKELKERIHDLELAHLEHVRQLKIDHSAEISRIREQLESDAAELEKKYEARLTNQAEEHAVREKMEQAELETRKNQHIIDLTKQHESAFQEMKNYYNDITLNNLALISSLKEQMEELKANHDRMEKQLNACQAENKKLAEPYKQAQSELSLLRRQLATYEQDKVTLANTKQRLSLITKELEDLRWENDVLELRFEKVEKERDRLHAEFVGAVLDVQQKTGLKGALLEKRMASMRSGVSHISDVPVTGDSTRLKIAQKSSSSHKNYSRPVTAPQRIPPSSSPDQPCSRVGETVYRRRALFPGSRPLFRSKPSTRADNDVVIASRFESGASRGRFRFKRPHISEQSKARWIKAVKGSSSRTNRIALAMAASEGASPTDGRAEILSQITNPTVKPSLLKECKPQKEGYWWTILEKKEKVAPITPYVCGRHGNGCRRTFFDKASQSVEALDLSFNYLSRNYMKHRYYPQILDCVRRNLSPIHSQEHPSDASIHDASDKSAASHQSSFSQELPSFREERRWDAVSSDPVTSRKMRTLRPLSASRADGRDRAFTKRKPQRPPNLRRASTAATVCDASQVFREFIPLPPRPDLPWLHGVKSRYFSIHSSQKISECTSHRPTTADVQIQTFQEAANKNEVSPDGCNLEKKSDDQTQCYLSHILNNSIQISYPLGQIDRNYAAVVATPKVENFKGGNASFMRTQTEDSCSVECPPSWMTKVGKESDDIDRSTTRRLALSMWYSYLQKKSRKGHFHNLSISPVRHVDIKEADSADSVVSAQSSPAIETSANSSHEDTGAGFSSMSVSQPESRRTSETKKSDATLKGLDQMDVDNNEKPDFLNLSFATPEKHERVSLKRKLKPTFPKRMKLKLMICSYLHYHNKEGDVNFVHPSVKQKPVETVEPSQETSSFDLKAVSSDRAENVVEKEKAVDGTVPGKESGRQNEESLSDFFCCVCQSKMTLKGSSEGNQICCDECAKNADALLREWEYSFNKEYGYLLSNDGLPKGTLMKDYDGQSLNARNACCITEVAHQLEKTGTDISGTQLVTEFGDKFSNACADSVCPETEHFDGNFMRKLPNDSEKLADDSYQMEFSNEPSNDDISKTKSGGDSESLSSRAELVSLKKRVVENTAIKLPTEADLSKTRGVGHIHTAEYDDPPTAKVDMFSTELDICNADAALFQKVRLTEDAGLCEQYSSATAQSGLPEKLIWTKCDFPSNAAEDFSTELLGDPLRKRLLKERGACSQEGGENPVVFTLSSVQEAIRSAMKIINPLKPLTEPTVKITDMPRLPPLVSTFPTPTSPTPTSPTFTSPTSTSPTSTIPVSPDLCLPLASSDCKTEPKKNLGKWSPVRASSSDEIKETSAHSRKAATATKPLQVYPLAVPPGTLKGDPKKIVYTEFPVQTYSFPSSRSGCVSKPRHLLVFYEVSKIRNKGNAVKTKKANVENEMVKSPGLNRSSNVTLRPCSVFLNNASVVDVSQEAVCLPDVPQEDRLKSVGATANFSCKRNNVRFSDDSYREQKSVLTPKVVVPSCGSNLDLITRKRRDSWLPSGKKTSLKETGFAESGKFHHRPEIVNLDDARLPRSRQDPPQANRDKACLCLKRGRKCNCSLTKHLHICPLPPPRPQRKNVFLLNPRISEVPSETAEASKTVAEKYCDGFSKKNVPFFNSKESWIDRAESLSNKRLTRPGSSCFRDSSAFRHLSPLGRSDKSKANDLHGRLAVETMPSLIEEPLSKNSPSNPSGNSVDEKNTLPQFVEANATQVPGAEKAGGRESPAVPTPPPPSPTASSPPSSIRRDRLTRRRTGNVSFRETQDVVESAPFLPQLPSRRRRQNDPFDGRKLDYL